MRLKLLLSLFALTGPVALAAPIAGLQPMDVFELEWADHPVVAPDGRSVVYQRMSFDRLKDRRNSALWLRGIGSDLHQPLTGAGVNAGSATWSPDGKRLAWVQRDIDRSTLPVLTLDPGNHTIIIGDQKIRLQPQRFCLYWYFAERSRARLSRIAIEDYPAYFEYPQSPYFSSTMLDGLLGRFDLLDPHRKMRGKFIAKVLEDGQLPMSWVLQRIAKINTQIRLSVPGLPALPFYLISSHGKRGTKCYGIKLPGEKIVVKGG